MENRLLCILLALAVFTVPGHSVAQESASGRDQLVQPQLERASIDEARINTDDFEFGAYFGLLSIENFGVNNVIGVRAAYHVTESTFFEMALGVSQGGSTSYERLSGSAKLLTDSDRDYTYYNVSVAFDLLPGEVFVFDRYTFNSAMYVIGGVGSTRFAGDDRFTINMGAGYRLVITDWIALHADVRDHVFRIDLLGGEETTHNLEIHSGVTLFF